LVSTLVNNYDGARSTTISFDQGWKFHLGDVAGAQATTFDDSAWTSLDVPHDWSISLAFNQGSKAGGGGGYLDGGTGWYRKTFTLPATSSGQKVFVQFDGVYMDSTVYLNGTERHDACDRSGLCRCSPRQRNGSFGRCHRPQLRSVYLRLASLEPSNVEVLRQRVVIRG
jgi:hypothetical protein